MDFNLMPIEKSAGAIIFRKETNKIKYLLLHYELGHWDFPKGNIEKGEKIEETVRREIKEETNIKDIEFIDGFKEWFKYFYKWEGKNIMKIVTYFLVETKTREVKLSLEHISYKWLECQDALKQLTFENSRKILKKADKFIQGLPNY